MADSETLRDEVVEHLDTLLRAALALTGRRERAEDLVQATALKAIEGARTFRPGSNVRAWLLRILRNTWIDEVRHARVVGPTIPAEEALLAGPEEPEPTSWSNAADLLENFSDEQIIGALRELPDDQRLTLYLTDVEGLDHAEVAKVLDVAVGTIKSRTARARTLLRQRLHAHARDLGFVERMQQ